MKFNALVAAAMVITSVNAAGKGGFRGFLKKGGGMTGSESLEKLVIDDDPELEPSQESPRCGARQRLSQIPLARRFRSGPSQDAPKSESEPVVTQDPSNNLSGTPQVPEPRKKDPVCRAIVEELYTSWEKLDTLNYRFRIQALEFHKLMMGEITKGKKDKRHNLNLEEIQKYIELNPEVIPKLKKFKKESVSLKEDHRKIWKRLKDGKCVTKRLEHLSLAGMKRREYLSEWSNEINLINLGEQ
ncbi:hypothetical protein BASA61_003999 [Batrachochytrium salamandrivorans]|nr:hypothetical protein BASA62_000325 [Batrachochytrium salamandrivorans]KAH6594497.1 hypothetical protein BASA61_003999 [Batrachochytrium salamandrivorans]